MNIKANYGQFFGLWRFFAHVGLLLLFPQALLSQTMVQGHVFDRQESSIPFANVILLRAVDSTMLAWATTDTLGRFQLNAPQSDLELLIQAGCLGYETMTRPLEDGRMDLAIVLEKKEAILKEIQIVRGKNQYMSFGNNGLSVRLAGSPYLVFTNALDMIQQLPLLSFDDQLKVFGRHGTPLVYINNRLVSDVRKELDGLKSEDIESVDIILNPGVEYPAETTSVIRITTKTNQDKGFFGSAMALGQYGEVPSFRGNINLGWQKKGLNLYLNGYSSESQSKQYQTVSQAIASMGSHEEIQSNLHYTFRTVNYSMGADYTKNEDLRFGAQYEWYHQPEINSRIQSTDSLQVHDELMDAGDSYYVSKERSTQHLGNLYLHYNPGKHVLNLDINLVSGENSDEDLSDISYWSMTQKVKSLNESDYWLATGKLIHTLPAWTGQLQSGGEYSSTHYNNNFRMLSEGTNIGNNQNQVDQQALSLFAAYSKKLSRFSFNAGGRWDFYQYVYKVPDLSNEEYTINSFSPLLNIDWHFNDQYTMSLGYKRVVKRPSYYQLRSSVSFSSPYLYESGNPHLKDCFENRVYWNLTAGKIYAELYYTSIRGFYSMMFDQYSDHEAIIVVKPQNIGTLDAINFLLSSNLKWQQLSLGMSLLLTKQYFHFQATGYNTPFARFNLKAAYEFSKTMTVSFNSSYQTPGNVRITKQQSSFKSDFNLNMKCLNSQLYLSFFVNDVFNTSREYWSVDINNISMVKKNRKDSRQVGMRLTYNFGGHKVKYGGNTDSAEIDRL